MQPKNIRPRVVANHVKGVLATSNLVQIKIGRQNVIAFVVWSGQDFSMRVDDATTAAAEDYFRIVAEAGRKVVLEIFAANELTAG